MRLQIAQTSPHLSRKNLDEVVDIIKESDICRSVN